MGADTALAFPKRRTPIACAISREVGGASCLERSVPCCGAFKAPAKAKEKAATRSLYVYVLSVACPFPNVLGEQHVWNNCSCKSLFYYLT